MHLNKIDPVNGFDMIHQCDITFVQIDRNIVTPGDNQRDSYRRLFWMFEFDELRDAIDGFRSHGTLPSFRIVIDTPLHRIRDD